MIIITGATGKLGAGVAERLLDRMPASEIGVSVRDPEKARALAERGVRVRRGDFTDPESLRDAFEGASQVLIVSANSTGGEAVRLHGTAIDAAKAAGVRRILYTSHMGASPASVFAPAADHAATEALLRESGVPFTSLRNGFYLESALQLMGPWLQTGKIVAPEDGPVSWTIRDDLAEAAAVVLAEEGRFDNPTPALTAAEGIDFGGIAALASELAGREIARVTVTDAEYQASMVAHGVPEAMAGMLVGAFVAMRRGEFAAVDPTLGRLLGRPPTAAREALAAQIATG